jgi:ATP-binding cassette subfamily F protein 3
LAKQAQSRAKALDKVEALDKPTKVSGPHIHFGQVQRAGDVVFTADDLGKRFGDHVLFERLNFALPRGKRLGIVGPNGCGKTTLLKILLGEEEPTEGEVRRGHLVFPGYLDQHLKLLADDQDVLRAVWPDPDPDLNEQKMRDLLSTFGLHGELVQQPVRQLSGGERSRAALAKLKVAGANVFVLDEPTNHLDIWACDALEEALRAFEGTCIVVTHDRYFLNQVADLVIVFEGGRTEVVYGNYDTYELLRAAREKDRAVSREAKPSAETAPTTATTKVKRKRKFPYKKAAEVEADIQTAEATVADLEAKLTTGEVYRDAAKLKATMAELGGLKAKLAGLYEHWEEAVELNG